MSPRPKLYKVICISLYLEDLKSLDAKVETMKARGLNQANRSALIRFAVDSLDLDSYAAHLEQGRIR